MSAVLYGGPPDLGNGRPWPVLPEIGPTTPLPFTAPLTWPVATAADPSVANDLDAAAKRLLKVSADPHCILSGEARAALDATVGELMRLAATLRGAP